MLGRSRRLKNSSLFVILHASGLLIKTVSTVFKGAKSCANYQSAKVSFIGG